MQVFSVQTFSASARTLPEAAGVPPERESPAYVDVGVGADRPARTRVHQVIASTLPFLAASTVTVAEPGPASPAKPKSVRVRITRKQRTRPPKARAKGQAQGPHRASTAGAAAGGGGEGESAGGAARDPALTLGHTVFTLRKERVEHLEAVSRLARALGASVR